MSEAPSIDVITERLTRLAESTQKLEAIWLRTADKLIGIEHTLARILILIERPVGDAVTLIEGEPAKPDLPKENPAVREGSGEV